MSSVQPTFPLPANQVIAVFLETIAYGIYLASFMALWFARGGIFRPYSTSLAVCSVFKANRCLLAVVVLTFMVASADIALGLRDIIAVFVAWTSLDLTGALNNVETWIDIMKTADYVLMMLIGGLVLIYRCYLVWDRMKSIVVLPIVLVGAQTGDPGPFLLVALILTTTFPSRSCRPRSHHFSTCRLTECPAFIRSPFGSHIANVYAHTESDKRRVDHDGHCTWRLPSRSQYIIADFVHFESVAITRSSPATVRVFGVITVYSSGHFEIATSIVCDNDIHHCCDSSDAPTLRNDTVFLSCLSHSLLLALSPRKSTRHASATECSLQRRLGIGLSRSLSYQTCQSQTGDSGVGPSVYTKSEEDFRRRKPYMYTLVLLVQSGIMITLATFLLLVLHLIHNGGWPVLRDINIQVVGITCNLIFLQCANKQASSPQPIKKDIRLFLTRTRTHEEVDGSNVSLHVSSPITLDPPSPTTPTSASPLFPPPSPYSGTALPKYYSNPSSPLTKTFSPSIVNEDPRDSTSSLPYLRPSNRLASPKVVGPASSLPQTLVSEATTTKPSKAQDEDVQAGHELGVNTYPPGLGLPGSRFSESDCGHGLIFGMSLRPIISGAGSKKEKDKPKPSQKSSAALGLLKPFIRVAGGREKKTRDFQDNSGEAQPHEEYKRGLELQERRAVEASIRIDTVLSRYNDSEKETERQLSPLVEASSNEAATSHVVYTTPSTIGLPALVSGASSHILPPSPRRPKIPDAFLPNPDRPSDQVQKPTLEDLQLRTLQRGKSRSNSSICTGTNGPLSPLNPSFPSSRSPTPPSSRLVQPQIRRMRSQGAMEIQSSQYSRRLGVDQQEGAIQSRPSLIPVAQSASPSSVRSLDVSSLPRARHNRSQSLSPRKHKEGHAPGLQGPPSQQGHNQNHSWEPSQANEVDRDENKAGGPVSPSRDYGRRQPTQLASIGEVGSARSTTKEAYIDQYLERFFENNHI
ncbi:hypothetical protein D9758_010925 [Tetrapyrgos nigripes]|uniref:Uncharacterized protein n=1 Tax=Tetrapyrgos nigripes TaxID=182062 RepID=A0A8H5FTS5_9AGAR|nr:hypothetical protein D9758_010925 [Tetrapyrgos nigripes]